MGATHRKFSTLWRYPAPMSTISTDSLTSFIYTNHSQINKNIISSILIELFISHHTCTENEYETHNIGISIIFHFLHYMTIGNLTKIRSTFGPRPQGFLLALSRSCKSRASDKRILTNALKLSTKPMMQEQEIKPKKEQENLDQLSGLKIVIEILTSSVRRVRCLF